MALYVYFWGHTTSKIGYTSAILMYFYVVLGYFYVLLPILLNPKRN